MPAIEKKSVLLFGKTGSGKSTVANMLLTGHLNEPRFAMGDSMEGVTGEIAMQVGDRIWEVTDTVGLGEETTTERNKEDIREKIADWLENYSQQYHHILYVTKKGRSDTLDEEIWQLFLNIFEDKDVLGDPYHGIRVVITHATEKWISENKKTLDKKFPEAKARYVAVDFPSMPNAADCKADPALAQLSLVTEPFHVMNRESSLERLETFLHGLENFHDYKMFTPQYSKFSRGEYVDFSKKILNFIDDLMKSRLGRAGLDASRMVVGVMSWLKHAFVKSKT